MITWPTELPQQPLINGYSETPQSTLLRFSPDAGRPKTRNRATAMPTDVNHPHVLTDSQKQALKDFYNNTTSKGAEPFFKVDIDGLNKEFEFAEPPEFVKQGTHWTTTLKLRILP